MKRTLVRISALLTLCVAVSNSYSQGGSDYKIAPLDILVIDLVGEKDLQREFRVSRTGTIDYPYLEKVEVAGKTTSEVKDTLTELLDKDYFVNPQITVDVKEYRVREVLVNGMVNKPGSVVLPGEAPLSILEAIGRAGGLTVRGNPNKIKFSRPGKFEKTFTLDGLKKETDKDKIITLEPGDVIDVEDKLF
jgi:polysaccharide biosynthesis/export protein VpsN